MAAPAILIVDDEPAIRKNTRDILEDEGYHVEEAGDAREGLNLVRAREFDIVLMDIQMPGLDGVSALQTLTSEKPGTDIIMISAHGNLETAVHTLKIGAADYLEKPFSIVKLRGAVKSVLEKRARRAALDALAVKKETFGRYKLLEKIAAGGTASVYKALYPPLNKIVALKVLHPHLTEAEAFAERFKREATTTARLNHPNIVQVSDYGVENGHHFLAMEFIEGRTLDQILARRGSLPPVVSLLVAAQAAQGLEYAHGQGVVHRDIKPSNIMIAKGGRVRVADFGIARSLSENEGRLTQSDKTIGTPNFMSPEQIAGEETGPPSDVFSFGIILYILATGVHPFGDGPWSKVIQNISDGKFVDPLVAKPGLSKRWAALITRALAPKPRDRFSDAGPLRLELDACAAEAGATNPARALADFFGDL